MRTSGSPPPDAQNPLPAGHSAVRSAEADDRRRTYRWVVLACCFLATFSYGLFYTIGVFFRPLQAEFGWSAAQTSSIQSFHLAVGIPSVFLVGWATDRFGARVTLACAGTLVGLGLALCSLASGLWHFYLFYGIATLGMGALWTLPTITVQRWFARQRGLALGIVVAGVGAGAAAYAPAANSLILAHGWRSAYLALATGTWVILMIAALLLPRRAKDRAEGTGEPGEGKAEATNGAAEKPSKVWRSGEWSLREAFHTRSFWLLAAAQLCSVLSVQMAMVHVVPFAISRGVDQTAAAGALSLIGALSIAGRVGMATVAQKTGFRWAFIICTSACALMFIWLLGVDVLWMIYVFAAVYGFFYGGKVPQSPGLAGYFFPGKALATIFGAISAVSAIGGVIGPLIGGFVWDATDSYRLAFIIGACFWALAAVLALLLKPPQKTETATTG